MSNTEPGFRFTHYIENEWSPEQGSPELCLVWIGDESIAITRAEFDAGDESSIKDLEGYGAYADQIWEGLEEVFS